MVPHPEARLKNTPANIRATGEFVVNLVDEAHAEAMNLTSIDAGPEIDEALLALLSLTPSSAVAPPRIATAPASRECRLTHYIATGAHQVAILAEELVASSSTS